MYTWGIWQSQTIQSFNNIFMWGHKKLKCHTFVTQYIAFVTKISQYFFIKKQ
uniref:Uncharacterized protein n=1 Tax=Staphylococcus aureus TaxID=1280 RepID=A0A1W5IIQ6_STAAU|nr:hypothetical protein pSM39_01 [Staphylococcus aureus]